MGLNVGVIGTGAMGQSHVRVYSTIKSANLVAICDADKDRAKTLAKIYGCNHYTDYNDMLDSERIEAVSICVPTKFHKKVSIDVMRRGIHTFVEKPIAASLSEGKAMIREASTHHVQLMIGHIERFNPVVSELKKRISRNELGKIYKIHCERLSPFPKRIVDVGVIVDFAIHDIDVLQYLIDSKITRIYAETTQRVHSAHEDLLIGTIKFENNILGVINANWLTPKKIREISVTGEKGMFVANYLTQELNFYENEFTKKHSDYNSDFMNIIEGKMKLIKIVKKEPLRLELEAFVSSILGRKKVPISGEDGLAALSLAHKFLESSRKNRAVLL